MSSKKAAATLAYAGVDIDLTEEEVTKVKEAINRNAQTVDLIRGAVRLKLNLNNFISLTS